MSYLFKILVRVVMYKTLTIWVEGEEDVIFFENIIKDKFSKKYDNIDIRSYNGDSYKNSRNKKKLMNWIDSFNSINNKGKQLKHYIFVSDLDLNCITEKKQEIKKYLTNISNDKILVVVKEVESWYLAGIDRTNSRRLKINYFNKKTNNITKEYFCSLLPKDIEKRPFLLDIVTNYSVNLAKNNNDSFKYFLKNMKKYSY